VKDPREIILKPHISERTMDLINENNSYTFQVALKATKVEIKKAVEEIFEVKVEKVTTHRMPGKEKSMGVHRGYTPKWKKAVVRLAEGDSIEIYEGM